jgi:hypothetical protein
VLFVGDRVQYGATNGRMGSSEGLNDDGALDVVVAQKRSRHDDARASHG